MRIAKLFLVLSLCSCKSYLPPTDNDVQGTYFGEDSTIVQYDKFGKKLFGACVKVQRGSDGKLYFFDQELRPQSKDQFVFDYVVDQDYGIANFQEIHQVRYVGKFDFRGNKLNVDYAVGKVGSNMSQYHFEGWR